MIKTSPVFQPFENQNVFNRKNTNNTSQYIKNQKSANITKSYTRDKRGINQNVKYPALKERLLAVGIGFAVIGAVLLTKRLMIPAKYRELFKSLNKINDFEEFVQTAYKGIVKCENMQNIAPEKINIVNRINNASGAGGYQPLDNSISILEEIRKFGKFTVFNTIRHELEHCRQCNWMLRYLGKDEYFKVWSKNHTFFNPQNNDKFTQYLRKSLFEKLERGFSFTLSQPKLEITSKKDLSRLNGYIASQGITGMAATKTLIEKEAYKIGDKAGSWYWAFNLGLHSSLH